MIGKELQKLMFPPKKADKFVKAFKAGRIKFFDPSMIKKKELPKIT